MLEPLEFRDGLGIYRPRGRYSLVDTVDLISEAITSCRTSGANRLLADLTGQIDLPVPTLVDRFLMVEDWAARAGGMVRVAVVVPPGHVHPRKFGVTVALDFGLICDVHTTEQEALEWLEARGTDAAAT